MLRNIPNYSDYFLVEGFTLCKPTELNKQDLIDFDEIDWDSTIKVDLLNQEDASYNDISIESLLEILK
jgi:hypothetical protein